MDKMYESNAEFPLEDLVLTTTPIVVSNGLFQMETFLSNIYWVAIHYTYNRQNVLPNKV